MLIFVRALSGVVTPLKVKPYETILSVKLHLFHLKGIPASQQHLLYDNCELPDETVLISGNIRHGTLLRLVLRLQTGPINENMTTMTRTSQFRHAQYSPLTPLPVSVSNFKIPSPYFNKVLPILPKLQTNELTSVEDGKFCRSNESIFNEDALIGDMNADYQSLSQTSTNDPSVEEEVSQIAEFLGYAIDETESKTCAEQNLTLASVDVDSNYKPLPGIESIQLNSEFSTSVPVTYKYQPIFQSLNMQDLFNTGLQSSFTEDQNPPEFRHPTEHPAMAVAINLNQFSTHFIQSCPYIQLGTVPFVYLSPTNQVDLEMNLPIAVADTDDSLVERDRYNIINEITTSYTNSCPEKKSSFITSLTLKEKETNLSSETKINVKDNMTVLHKSESQFCQLCMRRTKLAAGFRCRCDGWFCTKHHHPEDHRCDFNFKQMSDSNNKRNQSIASNATLSVNMNS